MRTLTYKEHKHAQAHTHSDSLTDTHTVAWRPIYLWCANTHTHEGKRHQRLHPSSEETLRHEKDHCVSHPLLLLSFLSNILLLIFALCTVDNVWKSFFYGLLSRVTLKNRGGDAFKISGSDLTFIYPARIFCVPLKPLVTDRTCTLMRLLQLCITLDTSSHEQTRLIMTLVKENCVKIFPICVESHILHIIHTLLATI